MKFKHIPKVVYQLDQEPGQRWSSIKEQLGTRLDLEELRNNCYQILDKYGGFNHVLNLISHFLSPNSVLHYEELLSLSEMVGLSLGQTIIIQLLYEVKAACTVFIFEKEVPELEQVYLRTMDWDTDFLRDITIELEIYQGKNRLGSAITWFGYVGFLTTENEDYRMSINVRRTQKLSLETMISNFIRTSQGRWPVSYLLRDIFLRRASFEQARQRLTDSLLISPVYITLHDRTMWSRSCIITRNPSSCLSIHTLSEKGYLVQTNCDQGQREPNIMNSIGRQAMMENLFSISQNKKIELPDLFKAPVIFSNTIYCLVEIESQILKLIVLFS